MAVDLAKVRGFVRMAGLMKGCCGGQHRLTDANASEALAHLEALVSECERFREAMREARRVSGGVRDELMDPAWVAWLRKYEVDQ